MKRDAREGRLRHPGRERQAARDRARRAEAEAGARPLPRLTETLAFTREGFEPDLAREVELAGGGAARVLEPGLLAISRVPDQELAFARQLLPVAGLAGEPPPTARCSRDLAWVEALSAALVPALRRLGEPGKTFALHVTAPDTEAGNRRVAGAGALEEALGARLASDSGGKLASSTEACEAGGTLAQVCLLRGGQAAVGAALARSAVSLYPGGRRRLARRGAAPSRAALKLEEAFEWLGRAPEPGELCVDLGAAPGGWTHVLLERGARVVAVDPARLRPELLANPRLRHVQASAFQYAPDEPVDWLFCDMAWRPLEAAALLAKWGRRGWAASLLANIKLPMKQRAEMLERVREIVAEGGWQGVRARQLYHDREEITLGGWRV